MKKMLEDFFANNIKFYTIKELIKIFNIKEKDYDTLLDSLYELECDGKIMFENDSYIHVPQEFYLKKGIVQHSTKGNFYLKLQGGTIINIENPPEELKKGDFVFVSTKDDENYKKHLYGEVTRIIRRPQFETDAYLFKGILRKDKTSNLYYILHDEHRIGVLNKDVNGAYPGDEVTILANPNVSSSTGKVINVINRKSKFHPFVYQNVDGELKWMPLGTTPFNINIKYDKKSYIEGEQVLVEIDENNNGTIVKRINDDGTIFSTIKNKAYDYGISVDFPEDVIKETDAMSDDISSELELGRTDLRDLPTFTIDSDHSKDLDDAVSIEVKDGFYRLYVHIADVSHYVYPGTKTFDEALNRGTSIYPPNYVIPMLPQKLSNGICSLNPNEDKLAKTTIIDIDFNGEIIKHKTINSVIRSNMKMSYSKVNDLLNRKNVDIKYIPYYVSLTDMHNLSKILENRRLKRGMLMFTSHEYEFTFDYDNKITGIQKREMGEAQKIIENFMVLNNELVSENAFNFSMPFIYRNHERPETNKIVELSYKIHDLKRYLKTITNKKDSRILQSIFLKLVQDKSKYEKTYYSDLFLSIMERAYYSNNNGGHYGLSLPVYATFTSPIRRLPDLINHLMMGYIIDGRYDELYKFVNDFTKWAEISTNKQYEAELFEKEIKSICLKDYTKEFMGETLNATIKYITHGIVYVTTKEGLFGYLENLDTKFDKVLIDGKAYKKGSSIPVMINQIKAETGELEFTLVNVPNDVKVKKKKL